MCVWFSFSTVSSLKIIQLETLLPGTFEELSILVERLPNSGVSPVYPFAGYVLNMNVSTRIHRDIGDQDICLVLVISDCEGGELVLLEPGLVLDLQNGDAVIFTSKDISHFNLHFVGRRASLVLHTDKCAKRWVKDGNGWMRNICFRSLIRSDDDANEDVGFEYAEDEDT